MTEEQQPLTADDIVSRETWQETAPLESPTIQEPVETKEEEPPVKSGEQLETPVETPQDPFVDYLQDLSTKTGLEFKERDEVATRFKEALEAKKQYDALSPRIREAIKAEAAGLDPAQFFSISKLDTEKMDAKTLLWQKYQIDKPKLVAQNERLAKMEFERDFKARFGELKPPEGLDEEELAHWQEQNAEEIEYRKLKLDLDTQEAKAAINEWKEKTLNPPAAQAPEVSYTVAVDEIAKDFEGIEIPLGEGVFNMNADMATKESIKQDLANPTNLLKEIGIDVEKNSIDTQKLAFASGLFRMYDKLGPQVVKHALEQNAAKTIKGKLENPPTNRQPVSPDSGFPDELSEVASIIAAKRQR